MKRVFNVDGVCRPDRHYMVTLQPRLEKIRKMVEGGAYFTINRARQYGKTTTLRALGDNLKDDYTVASLDFLAQLRAAYLDHDVTPAFWSVILAGVHDIRNIRRKIRPDGERRENSSWNIAADFRVNMSFSAGDIAEMLEEYEADHHTNMEIRLIADLLYDYTSGYPYLVSWLCRCMDEDLSGCEKFSVQIANRIFEMRLYNRYLLDYKEQNNEIFAEGSRHRNQFLLRAI